jgi:vancomycin resistance protein YoaR
MAYSKTYTPYHIILFCALLPLAGVCFGHTRIAQGKTVSVKDIIRYEPEAATLNYEIIPENVTQGNQLYAYAEKPLFLLPVNLKRTTPKKSSYINIAELHAWTQKTLLPMELDAQDARMTIQDGRVTDFDPGRTGFYPDSHATTLALLAGIKTGASSTSIIAVKTQPRSTLKSTNTLGIETLLSGGLSDFSGSSKNRKANIEAGSKKVRGVLVPPGETFSFNHYLGDVTAEDGFKPEIVIKADGLKPELGGGICQVSSTLYRAVMQSGMPIPTRRNHAFSVNHYFPPGTDATVYSPYTDFKFINDTPATVLIWNYYKNDHTLAFDLYGTNDTRSVAVEEPMQWDRKPDGSLKTSWTRRVRKDGVTREDVFKSNYLPPALFKKEEKFVVTTPTPGTQPPTLLENSPNPPIKTN